MNSMLGSKGFGSQMPSAPKGYNYAQNYTPQQMQLFESLFGNISPESFTGRLAGGDENIFDQIEAPDLRQFAGLQGNLASRFSGMGMGGRKSSGFQNSATSAASNFAQELGARRIDLQKNAIRDLMGMSSDLLGQKPYSLIEKQKPWWQQLLLGIGQTAVKSGVESMFKGPSSSPVPGGA